MKSTSSGPSRYFVKHSTHVAGGSGCSGSSPSTTLLLLFIQTNLESLSEPDGLPPLLPPLFPRVSAPTSPSSSACASVARAPDLMLELYQFHFH